MKHIVRSTDIHAPLAMVYNQWTQFEDFPKFMPGAIAVHQLDDTHVLWKLRIFGKRFKWLAEITEQAPDDFIAWRSSACLFHEAFVVFKKLDEKRTRVTIDLEYEPLGFIGKTWANLGLVEWQITSTLLGFGRFIEQRAVPTGGWRGVVHHGTVDTSAPVLEESAPVLEEWTLY